ncbi:hypothetical protein HD554DRAFT_2038406 [Boletus coccyginus]|nr:hypothetical protein HD554DRAFT_2038406 [Boletus coccyginus]
MSREERGKRLDSYRKAMERIEYRQRRPHKRTKGAQKPASIDVVPTTAEASVAESHQKAHQDKDIPIQSLHARAEGSNSEIAPLEKIVRELRNQLAESERLNEVIKSLSADLHTQ